MYAPFTSSRTSAGLGAHTRNSGIVVCHQPSAERVIACTHRSRRAGPARVWVPILGISPKAASNWAWAPDTGGPNTTRRHYLRFRGNTGGAAHRRRPLRTGPGRRTPEVRIRRAGITFDSGATRVAPQRQVPAGPTRDRPAALGFDEAQTAAVVGPGKLGVVRSARSPPGQPGIVPPPWASTKPRRRRSLGRENCRAWSMCLAGARDALGRAPAGETADEWLGRMRHDASAEPGRCAWLVPAMPLDALRPARQPTSGLGECATAGRRCCAAWPPAACPRRR